MTGDLETAIQEMALPQPPPNVPFACVLKPLCALSMQMASLKQSMICNGLNVLPFLKLHNGLKCEM